MKRIVVIAATVLILLVGGLAFGRQQLVGGLSTGFRIAREAVRSGARPNPTAGAARGAQAGPGQIIGVPWRGQPGVNETIGQIMAREARNPPVPAVPRPTKESEEFQRTPPKPNPSAPNVSQWPPAQKNAAPSRESPQTVGASFKGITVSESGFIPPDSNGAVGATQVLAVSNGRIKVFDKTGVPGALNASLDTFFASVDTGAGVSDPHVRYDRLSGRWFVAAINVSTPNRVVIAVSNSSTITNGSSFTFFQFQHDLVGATPNPDTGGFADYPTLGVDKNALYIGANIFNAAGTGVFGCTAYVVRKSDLLSGTLTVTVFRQIGAIGGIGEGPWAPQGVDNDDPAATEGYFIGVDGAVFSQLGIRRVSNPGGTPAMSGNLPINVPTTRFPILQPHRGVPANQRLSAVDDRLFAAAIHKNKITGVASLWTAHNIEVSTSGVGVSGGGRNGSRWYEIGNLIAIPSLTQSGTLFDSAADNPRGYWIPSVAINGQGHLALGSNYANLTVDFAGIATAGRLRTDAAGSTQAATLAVVSSTVYNIQAGSDGKRWGDYSQVVVDPTDDQTLWTFQEYCDATNSWGVRVVQLKAPPPAALPAGLTAATGQASVNVVVTGASSAGSEFFDPGADAGGPGFANRLAATVAGGVTVNSVTFNNPTQITLNLNTTAASAGAKTLTVTNPDGQSVNGTLTITGGGGGITLSPATLPSGIVGTAYTTTTITASGGTGPYTFTTPGPLPTGLSLSTAGALSGTPMAAGSFSFTVTATGSLSATGQQAYTVVVTCPTIGATPTIMPGGTLGAPYNQSLSGTGGTAPYGFALSAGSELPGGLSLAANGAITGTPTEEGAFIFTINVTDSKNCAGSVFVSLNVTCPTIGAAPATLPGGTVGAAYNQSLAGTGGTAPYTFTLAAGSSLPGGLSLAASGAITGTAMAAGSFSFTVNVADANNCTGSVLVSLAVVCPNIAIVPGSLVAGTAGQVYPAATLAANGGTSPYTYSLLSGSLPPGMSLSGAGVISGTPTQSGNFGFAVKATDARGCQGTQGYTLTINCPSVALAPTTLPPGLIAQPYNQTIMASGGTPAYTFSAGAGLPGNVTLSQNGALTGTPTQSGSFTFTVTATDANSCSGARQYTLLICPIITITPTNLPNGFVSTAYNATLAASGGAPGYSFTLGGGALPGGVNLSSGGTLSGTPSQAGTFAFTIKATDANGCAGTRSYSVIISGAGLQFYPLAHPVRLLDTRPNEIGCDAPGQPIAAGAERTQLARRTCDGLAIPPNALAITGNITPVQSGGGYLTLFPSNATRPVIASSNYDPNQAVNNVFTVGLGPDGAFKIFALNTTHVVVDVTGYYAPPATGGLFFHPLPHPARLLETRQGESGCDAPGLPIGAATTRMQQGRVSCDGVAIPPTAMAIVGNATTVSPLAAGYLTLFPGNATLPLAASGNYTGGDIVNTPFTVGLGPDGVFKIYTLATTHLVVDVLGYYSAEAVDANGAGLLFTPLAHPVRLLETRASFAGCFAPAAPIAGGVDFTQQTVGICDALTIPASALGVVGTATAVQTPANGYLTLWPSNALRPIVSALNYDAGATVNRHFTVGLGPNGAFKLFPLTTTHLVIDLAGYFAP